MSSSPRARAAAPAAPPRQGVDQPVCTVRELGRRSADPDEVRVLYGGIQYSYE